jgi:ATP-dependent Clp protease protease subunit
MNGTKKLIAPEKDKEDSSPIEKIEDCFHDNRIHFLCGQIEPENVRKAIQWIVYENSITNDENNFLTLYVNSEGGNLYECFALVDIMKASKRPIRTIGIGSVMSAAFLIFCSGEKGHRIIGRNTGIMCHQYHDEFEGKHHDIKSRMKESDNCNNRMLEIVQEASSAEMKTIKSKLLYSSDVWLKAEEMIALGLADQIL